MKGFSEIIGHEDIVEYLQNSLRNRKVSHAYIFNGEDGSGKNMLAGAFAKALECEAGYGDACNMCRSCMQFDSGSHPDIRYVSHEKPDIISVDEIREQVDRDVIIKPYSSKYKIYIIDEAEKLPERSQNALLKTIEEPPAYVVIMLLVNNAQALLPTVRSRCISLDLRAVDTDKICDYLMKELRLPDYQARLCAAYAQGNVGRAKAMASSDRFDALNTFVIDLLKRLGEMDVYEIVFAIQEMMTYKSDIYDMIDLMEVWYHDVLILKATNDTNHIVYRDEFRALNRKAVSSSYEGLENIMEALEKAKVRLRANVNFETAMELMLLTMKEN